MIPNQTESTTKSSNPGTLILRSVGIVFIPPAVACFLVSMYGATSAFNTALNSSTAITPAVLASQISESLKASFIAVPFELIGLTLIVIPNTQARRQHRTRLEP